MTTRGNCKITPAQPETNPKKSEEKVPPNLAPNSLSCDCTLLEPPTLPDTIDTMTKINQSSTFWEGGMACDEQRGDVRDDAPRQQASWTIGFSTKPQKAYRNTGFLAFGNCQLNTETDDVGLLRSDNKQALIAIVATIALQRKLIGYPD